MVKSRKRCYTHGTSVRLCPSLSRVHMHCTIPTKSKKAELVPEILRSLQLCDQRSQAPRSLTRITQEGRKELPEPTKCMEGRRGQERNRTLGNRFCTNSHISHKRKSGLVDKNGTAAPGDQEGARRCSCGHRPNQACSVLTGLAEGM